MLSRDEHDALVGRLYASALGDAPWSAALQDIAERFGAHASLMQLSDAGSRIVAVENHGYSPEFAAAYFASEVHANDPRIPYFYGVSPGSIYFDHALYDVEEMNRDPRCRASNDAVGTKYSLGMVAGLPDGFTAVLSLLNSEAEGHASESAIDAFRRLAPHVQQAFSLGQIAEQRATTRTILLDALARRADGVILLNRSGAPIFLNDAAQAILAAGDGLAFTRGEFVTHRGPETRRLRQLIGGVTLLAPPSETIRPGGETLVTRASGKRPYIVRVMPAPPMERFLSGPAIACVIHLHDLAAVRVPSKALLMAAFGLTEREADLSIALVRCANLIGAAADAGMALNTARNHLQSVFRKSGTKSQAEAVQLFSRLA